jgi:hypothetical protein
MANGKVGELQCKRLIKLATQFELIKDLFGQNILFRVKKYKFE